jgi:DinB superfamily
MQYQRSEAVVARLHLLVGIMHPRMTELHRYMDEKMDELRRAWEAVPPGQRGIRPAPDRWSAAENIHHLVIVERRLVGLLERLIVQARALPPETDASPILPTLQLDRLEVRSQRFRTSEASTPIDTNAATVWADLEHVRAAFRAVIATGDGLALAEVSAPHPVIGSFTGYGWIAFAGAHAARHADQIRENQVKPTG